MKTKCFNDIYITSDDIKVLDFNEDWKIVQETAHGELKTICSKEECDNMRLNFVESAKEENNIVLAGVNEKNYIIKRISKTGYVESQNCWDKTQAQSPIYRIDWGVYGINIYNSAILLTKLLDYPRDICDALYRHNYILNLKRPTAKLRGKEPGKYVELDISYGTTDTIHVLCSLEEKTKLQFYPFITSDRTQEVIELGNNDEMLSMNNLALRLTNHNFMLDLAEELKKEEQDRTTRSNNAKKLLKTRLEEKK